MTNNMLIHICGYRYVCYCYVVFIIVITIIGVIIAVIIIVILGIVLVINDLQSSITVSVCAFWAQNH